MGRAAGSRFGQIFRVSYILLVVTCALMICLIFMDMHIRQIPHAHVILTTINYIPAYSYIFCAKTWAKIFM